MNAETFTDCKNTLEEFYKRRIQFNISKIEIKQVDPDISVYSYLNDIHFRTHIKFTEDRFLIGDLYKNLRPVITYALSYTKLRKFCNNDIDLTEDNTIINYNYEYIDRELYVKDLEVILRTFYDFYNVDYDLYFSVIAELENKNELILSHTELIPKDPKVINLFKIFKSDECIICMSDKPSVLFCNCGHLCYCVKCYKIKTLSTCPICKMDNEIIRMIE